MAPPASKRQARPRHSAQRPPARCTPKWLRTSTPSPAMPRQIARRRHASPPLWKRRARRRFRAGRRPPRRPGQIIPRWSRRPATRSPATIQRPPQGGWTSPTERVSPMPSPSRMSARRAPYPCAYGCQQRHIRPRRRATMTNYWYCCRMRRRRRRARLESLRWHTDWQARSPSPRRMCRPPFRWSRFRRLRPVRPQRRRARRRHIMPCRCRHPPPTRRQRSCPSRSRCTPSRSPTSHCPPRLPRAARLPRLPCSRSTTSHTRHRSRRGTIRCGAFASSAR